MERREDVQDMNEEVALAICRFGFASRETSEAPLFNPTTTKAMVEGPMPTKGDVDNEDRRG
jgi:hypothetical protein